jgi:DNA-binding GntR family transcriptional regulator
MVSTRLVAEQGAPAELEAIMRMMDECAASGRFERWADLNTRFHYTISLATGLPLLVEMMDRVLGRWDRIRRYYFNGVLSHRVVAAQQEHRDIVSAIKHKDFAALETHVRQHNRNALAAYMQYLNPA